MDIVESICEGVVEPSYKTPTREDANHACYSRNKRGESASSQTHSVMGESAGNHRKQYLDCPLGESKICLINGPGHSYDECKVLGDFGAKYAKGKLTKDRGNHPVPMGKITGNRKITPLLIMW